MLAILFKTFLLAGAKIAAFSKIWHTPKLRLPLIGSQIIPSTFRFSLLKSFVLILFEISSSRLISFINVLLLLVHFLMLQFASLNRTLIFFYNSYAMVVCSALDQKSSTENPLNFLNKLGIHIFVIFRYFLYCTI